MNISEELSYFNGFLKAVEIAGGRKIRLSANAYENSGDVAADLVSFFNRHQLKWQPPNVKQISRDEFLSGAWEPSKQLLSKLPPNILRDMEWQFEEFLGLISTGLDKDNPFNPLCRSPLYCVQLKGMPGKLLFLIEFPSVVLVLISERNT